MIKVLVITEEGRGGGALFRIKSIAKELSEQVETIVLCPKNTAPFLLDPKVKNLKVIRRRLYPLTRSFIGLTKYVVNFIPELFIISRIIKEEKPDVIHCNSSWQIKGVIAGNLFSAPVIWHMNDTRQPGIIRLLFRRISKMADAFIYASEATKKYYKAYNSITDRIKEIVIPAPVDLNLITFKKRDYSSARPIRALMIGYINKNKGVELIIECAALMKDVNISFDIVGPVINSQKDYMSSLKELIVKHDISNINFLGFRDITDELLLNYDVYICSSTNESSPIAVWQALASGLPLISTQVGDVKDVLDKFECGLLVEEFDPVNLKRQTHKFISATAKDKILMSRNARKAAESMFGLKTVANSYFRFYTEVVSEV